jgi:hypothetical protein
MGVSGQDAGVGMEQEFGRLVKSLLLTASCPFRMVVLADSTMQRVVSEVRRELCLDEGVPEGTGRVSIDVLPVSSAGIESMWRELGVVVRHHAGPFTQAKYAMDRYFGEETKAVLVVDTDFVFFDDVCRLWGEASADLERNKDALVSIEIADESRVDNSNHYLNAGMVYMRLDRMRAAGWSTRVVEETKRTPKCLSRVEGTDLYYGLRGDQNFFYCAVMNHPEWLVPMRKRWNLSRCRDFEGTRFGSRGTSLPHTLGAIHYNCDNRPNHFSLEIVRVDSFSLNQLQEHTYKGV